MLPLNAAPERKEFLKGYVMALIAEGAFSGMTSPGAMAKKAVALFSHDLPTVLGELAEIALEQSGSRLSAAAMSKVNDFIGDIGKRGLKAVWADLQAQYQRGVEANTRGSSRRG